jgi:hypothetical protein
MMREYVEGHRFNETKYVGNPYPIVVVKGCIRCDGKDKAFMAWCPTGEVDNAKELAQQHFNTYLNKECTCMWPENPEGKSPLCPIHAEAQG